MRCQHCGTPCHLSRWADPSCLTCTESFVRAEQAYRDETAFLARAMDEIRKNPRLVPRIVEFLLER